MIVLYIHENLLQKPCQGQGLMDTILAFKFNWTFTVQGVRVLKFQYVQVYLLVGYKILATWGPQNDQLGLERVNLKLLEPLIKFS